MRIEIERERTREICGFINFSHSMGSWLDMFAHAPNVPIGLVGSGLFAQKPKDCICGGSRHMKWISLFWWTIRHPKSTVSRMCSDISFKRMRHYIVRSTNLIRLFGFLWSQRKKCLLLQYNVLISNHNTYDCAHTLVTWHLTVRLHGNLHKPIFEFSSFDFCLGLVQWEFSKRQMRFHFKKETKQNEFHSVMYTCDSLMTIGKVFSVIFFCVKSQSICVLREKIQEV